MREESSKRGKRIRLFGNIAKSDVRTVAIECPRKVPWLHESNQPNRYSTRPLVVVRRLACFRGVTTGSRIENCFSEHITSNIHMNNPKTLHDDL
jgi:hypothetical protein